MKHVLFYPAFPDRDALLDQMFRAIWHFAPFRDRLGEIVFPYAGEDRLLLDPAQIATFAKPYLSRDFDPAIADIAPDMSGHLSLCGPEDIPDIDPAKLAGILLWHSGNDQVVAAAHQIAQRIGVPVIDVDPKRAQQETLSAIKFAWSLLPEEDGMAVVRKSAETFFTCLSGWRNRPVTAYGSGPTFGQIAASGYPVNTRLNMVCNSAVTDPAVLDLLDPGLLFCGDPVQHCGANRYAGEFRAALRTALEPEHRVLITQLGYVPYFRMALPPAAHDRIIGIGNDRRPQFNVDLTAEYMTAATANVLTMLMLPVAFTISRDVHILGCDGRPFADSTRPWTHADEAEYQSRMACTHRLHPAFWQRPHETEFLSYCTDMEDIITTAEATGAHVGSVTPSYIPALAKRFVPPARWQAA